MINESERNKEIREDEISLRDLILKIKEWWQYLWSKKWIILAAGIVGGLLGLGYSFIKKPIYKATTTFVLEGGEKSGGGLAAYAGVASMMGIDLGGGGGIFQGDNILELYKSRKMIEKTLLTPIDDKSEELLIDRFIAFNKMKKGWRKKPRLYKLSFAKANLSDRESDFSRLDSNILLRDSILGKIVDNINKNYLSVEKPDKKLSIIKVDVEAKDEVFAKKFNDELVKNVNDFFIQTKTKKMVKNLTILTHKTDSVRNVMNGAIYSSVAVGDATPNLNPTRQIQRAAPVQKAQFSAEANKMVLGELLKNLEMANITLLKETPLIQVVDEPIYPLKNDKPRKIILLIVGAFLSVMLITMVLILRRFMMILNGK